MTITVNSEYKFSILQMAAEAYLLDLGTTPLTGALLIKALVRGNDHSSKFTESEATAFVAHWEVVSQKDNTGTGFSGTLFRCIQDDPATGAVAGELVMSFRSTEFIDDAVRDNKETNEREIFKTGWAWGQLRDMEAWYAELNGAGAELNGKPFSVTGYSLGGHLATAFNLLHPNRAAQVVTFNGAGVGQSGTIAPTTALAAFTQMTAAQGGQQVIETAFGNAAVVDIYRTVRTGMTQQGWSVAQAKNYLNGARYVLTDPEMPLDPAIDKGLKRIEEALGNVATLIDEAARIKPLTAGGGADPNAHPLDVAVSRIEAATLDYQLAVSFAGDGTTSAGLWGGFTRTFGKKAFVPVTLTNQYDIVGMTTPSAVANSQWHAGADVQVFIEDQPLYRGGIAKNVLAGLFQGFNLLQDKYALSDFGDTHSLVLLQDALAVENMLVNLLPAQVAGSSATIATLNTIFEAASNLRRVDGDLLIGGSQGRAIGDVLENVVNALGDMLGVFDGGAVSRLKGNPAGNTWAEVTDGAGYTGRTTFYKTLNAILASYSGLLREGVLGAAPTSAGGARTSFGLFLSLYYLTPFTLTGNVDAALGINQAGLYKTWNEDRVLSPTQLALGSAQFTDSWLNARAQLSQRISYYNTANARYDLTDASLSSAGDAAATGFDYDPTVYIDVATGMTMRRGRSDADRYVVFGAAGNDSLAGGSQADSLFGGDGDDVLAGVGGNDYLEGDAGNDQLDGGAGNDTLVGGRGQDRYNFSGAFGQDVIIDAAGDGSITVDNAALAGGPKIGAGKWEGSTGGKKYTYVQTDDGHGSSTLLITQEGGGNAISILNWQPGQLGIVLADAAPPAGPVTLNLQGDFKKRYNEAAKEYVQDQYGNYVNDGAQAGASDILRGSWFGDSMAGLGGNDMIDGLDGDDTIEGGDGADLLVGGGGADILRGGAGDDFIFGSGAGVVPPRGGRVLVDERVAAGPGVELARGFGWVATYSDVVNAYGDTKMFIVGSNLSQVTMDGNSDIDGGDGNDQIGSGTGDDLVHGGVGNDNIFGMKGADVLFGDDGNDTIDGDGAYYDPGSAEFTAGAAHGADVLIGGAGDDVLFGNGNNDRLEGGTDADRLFGDDSPKKLSSEFTGNDYLDGGDGNDYLDGGGRDDQLYGGAGDDTMWGDASAEGLETAFNGNDMLDGGEGNDQMAGGGGNDVLLGGAGRDVMNGDAPADVLAAEAHGNDLLDGGTGNDFLAGDGGNDTLFGGSDDDELQGDNLTLANTLHGNDELHGGLGQDTLYGNGGDDALFGDEGNDYLMGDYTEEGGAGGNDQLDGGAGNDTLAGGSGNDMLRGGDGNDVLLGGEGNDTVVGGSGDDYLVGGAGSNLLQGGDGNDTLIGSQGDIMEGGAGDDIYVFTQASASSARGMAMAEAQDQAAAENGSAGPPTIHDSQGRNRFIFAGTEAQMAFTVVTDAAHTNDLIVQVGDATVRVTDGLLNDAVESMGIDGGALLVREDLMLLAPALTITGGAADDDILGSSQADTIDGGAGNDLIRGGAGSDLIAGGEGDDLIGGAAGADTLSGGSGNDAYFFGRGDGQDVIDNSAADSAGAVDQIVFAEGILASEVSVGRTATDDLLLRLGADTITVLNHFAGDGAGAIDRVLFQNATWYLADLAKLAVPLGGGVANSGDDTITGGAGTDNLHGGAGQDQLGGGAGNDLLFGDAGNDSLIGGEGDDKLDGGTGNDRLVGGAGNDVYTFRRGDGADTIDNVAGDNAATVDEIRFGTGINAADVSVSRGSYGDMVLTLGADSVTVRGHFSYPGGAGIDRVVFENAVWSTADLELLSSAAGAHPGDDTMTGSAGYDVLHGGGGNDSLDGGDGGDQLYGDAGNDAVLGGAGDDLLNGGDGDDVLDGGTGRDNLVGGSGNDVYRWQRGDGGDTIDNSATDNPSALDEIRFGAGIAAAEVRVGRDDQDNLLLVVGEELIYVSGHFSSDGARAIDRIVFDDAVWNQADIARFSLLRNGGDGNDNFYGTRASETMHGGAGNDTLSGAGGDDALYGDSGNDVLFGEAGNDTLDGGAGADNLYGGTGGDTYRFDLGAGSDSLAEYGDADSIDRVQLGSGISASNIVLYRNGHSLQLTVKGTGDSLWLTDQFASEKTGQIERIEFADGTVWSAADLQAMLTAAATSERNDTISGFAGADRLDGRGGDDLIYGYGNADTLLGGSGNDTLEAGDGNDVLDGGSGNDKLWGGKGADIYLFDRDGGSDILAESGGSAEFDVLRLGAGIVAADVTLYRNNADLVLVLDNGHRQLRILAWDTIQKDGVATDYRLERIEFADGSSWDAAAIAARIIPGGAPSSMTGTAGDDVFQVDHGDDVVVEASGQGTDTVRASVSYALTDNVENLVLTGVLNINGIGNNLNNVLTGNSGDNILQAYGTGVDTLIGGAGDDTYYSYQNNAAVREDASGGIDTLIETYSAASRYIMGANIENLDYTSGYINAGWVTGNALDNIIWTDAAHRTDSYDGGAGADTIISRSGGGYFYVDNPGDRVLRADGAPKVDGYIFASGDYTLSSEWNMLTMMGNNATRGAGNDGNNIINGSSDINPLKLIGFNGTTGNYAANILAGGKGNDTYILGSSDTVEEGPGAGIDTIMVGWSLGAYLAIDLDLADFANVENVDLKLSENKGSVLGSNADNFFSGNNADNRFVGGAGNDRLVGLWGNDILDGGSGADTMQGDGGNDSFYVDNAGDVVFDSSGVDTVYSSLAYTLGTDFENLVLTGSGAIDGTGNALDNTLDGNSNGASNLLRGGLGNDTYLFAAGAGQDRIDNSAADSAATSDSILVDAAIASASLRLERHGADLIVRRGADSLTVLGHFGGGESQIDQIRFADGSAWSLDYIAAHAVVVTSGSAQDDVLTGGAQPDAIFGGAGNDALTALAGDDTLDGGSGRDTMQGDAGNDTYYVDEAGDVVIDSAGVDQVNSSIGYTLGASIENLSLTGSAAIDGTGNALDNTLDGLANGAANLLTGGAGNDTYIFGAGAGRDRIDNRAADAASTVDRVYIDATIALAAVSLRQVGNDLVIDTGGADSFTVLGHFSTDGAGRIDQIVFDNGTVWTQDYIANHAPIFGTAQDDLLTGAATADKFDGGAGNDTLRGLGGDDSLYGGTGDDVLDGGGGADYLYGGSGNDTYIVTDGEDVMVELDGEGIDTVIVAADIGYIYLRDQVENVVAGQWAIGIIGNDQANRLTGGSGDDHMQAGAGADTYVIAGSSGNDTIYDGASAAGEINTVLLSGWASAQVTVTASSYDLVLHMGSNSVTLGNWFSAPENAAMRVEFDDGSSWSASDMVDRIVVTAGTSGDDDIRGGSGAQLLSGSAGNDTLWGGGGADTIDGGDGDDYLLGGAGADTYVFASAHGMDYVSDLDNAVQEADIIVLHGVAPGAITVARDITDLYLIGEGGADVVALDSWFSAASGKLKKVLFDDGTLWSAADLDARVQLAPATQYGDALYGSEGADTLGGLGGDDYLYGNGGADLLRGGDGADFLAGGAGNDTLDGGAGDDFYLFERGMGRDVIVDGASGPASEVIRLSGILVEEATFARDHADLVLNIGASDSVRVLNYFGGMSVYVSFDDGEWDDAVFAQVAPRLVTGSAAAETLNGNSGDDFIKGLAGNDTLNGNGGNDRLDGGSGADKLAGGAGDDDYEVDDSGDVVTEAAGAGTDTVYSSVSHTLAVNVENLVLTGSGAIAGTGNSAANALTGNAMDNTLDGGAGADTLSGNNGNDTYIVDSSGDTVIEWAGGGSDTVRASVSFILSDEVEALILTGTAAIDGRAGARGATLTGNSAINTLYGGAGNDRLDGGSGADKLFGYGGNDVYVVDNAADVATESAGEGSDTVEASLGWTLGANFENLVLTGSAAINGTGNTLANTLTGNSGANLLDGGSGADSMAGGAGNDTYVVDDSGDIVIELAGGGTDLVQSSVSATLAANVEALTLTGSASLNGAGNELANTLTGNAGANILDGASGSDSMAGGAGNDTYIVDSSGDVVTEAASAGTDEVLSSVSHVLAVNVENLTLMGAAAINGTGNAGANVIVGNAAANILDGGAGNDTLRGGAGDDTYIVDASTDVITENLGEGIDSVQTALSWTLGSNLERLSLTGTAAVNGTGNSLDNLITGNSAINTLTGGAGNDTLDGGAGADKLNGNAGDDVYVVDNSGDVVTEAAAEGIDTVRSSIAYTLGSNLEVLELTGSVAINGTGNTADNMLTGNALANTLDGAAGNDLLQGAAGADVLTDTSGKNLFAGGDGNDSMTGGTGAEMFIGGKGNDTIVTSTGSDVIAFNRGDGQDTIAASTTRDNTISLGRGITYADLLFSKSGSDLVLTTGSSEQITLKDWYVSSANHSVATLQIVIEGSADYDATSGSSLKNRKVQQFNFDGLAGAFDAAKAANPNLTSWALSSSLLSFYLSGSDTAAIGGDISYQYASTGALSAIGMSAAQAILASGSFGASTQAIQGSAAIGGPQRLM